MTTKLRWESKNPYGIFAEDEKATRASAAQRTFWTTELAEQIFLHLPPRTILVNIQRTCKQFQAVVEGSKPIRQALFFEPISDIRLQLAWCYKRSRCNVFWIRSTEENNGCASKGEKYCIWLHPLIRRIAENDKQYEARCTYANASWRKQLASQPPMSHCVLDVDDYFNEKRVFARKGCHGIMLRQIAKRSTRSLRDEQHIHLEAAWHEGNEDWAWNEMPAKELLGEIRASADNHDEDMDSSWCNSDGHYHSFSTVASREGWGRKQLIT